MEGRRPETSGVEGVSTTSTLPWSSCSCALTEAPPLHGPSLHCHCSHQTAMSTHSPWRTAAAICRAG